MPFNSNRGKGERDLPKSGTKIPCLRWEEVDSEKENGPLVGVRELGSKIAWNQVD